MYASAICCQHDCSMCLLAPSRSLAPCSSLAPSLLVASLVSLLAPLSCPRGVPVPARRQFRRLQLSVRTGVRQQVCTHGDGGTDLRACTARVSTSLMSFPARHGHGRLVTMSVPIIGTGENKLPTIHVQVRSQHLFRFPAWHLFRFPASVSVPSMFRFAQFCRSYDSALFGHGRDPCMRCPQTRVDGLTCHVRAHTSILAIAPSLPRSSLPLSLSRSLALSLPRSLAPSLPPSLTHSLTHSHSLTRRSLAHSLSKPGEKQSQKMSQPM